MNQIAEQLGSFASEVSRVARVMASHLSVRIRNNQEQEWLKTNLAKFSQMLQGQRDLVAVATLTLSELAWLVHAQQGVFYIVELDPSGESVLKHLAHYAFRERKDFSKIIRPGEGLLGQCALDKRLTVLNDVPIDHFAINSGLGESRSANVVVLPVLFEGQVKAIVELASFHRFSAVHLRFLEQFAATLGVVLHSISASVRTEEFLRQSQALTEELKEQARLFSEQKRQIEQTKLSLEQQAAQLAQASRYKSEFLANMSHELRTPINSLLILSELLSENPDGNLTPKQVEFARTIHASGTDLIALINDILDLSKVESGTITLELGTHALTDLGDYVERTFGPIAEARGVRLSVKIEPDLPTTMHTDFKRLKQVLKNLLSNAFKFTDAGEVTLHVHRTDNRFIFDVTDTGIGIPQDQQALIFDAFRQADGTINRKYGGTGLGLSISRELARLLGGEIKVRSRVGGGSTFSLALPIESVSEQAPSPEHVERVSDQQTASLPTALYIGGDGAFARSAFDRDIGVRPRAESHADKALARALETPPDVIVLDSDLPDSNAWRVLDRLKHDPTIRHMPVIWVGPASQHLSARSQGAFAAVTRPATALGLSQPFMRAQQLIKNSHRRVLVACADSDDLRKSCEALRGDDIEIVETRTGQATLRITQTEIFDCVAVCPFFLDMTAEAFLQTLQSEAPVALMLVHGTVDPAVLAGLRSRVAFQTALTMEELIGVTALYLHRSESSLPPTQRRAIEKLRGDDPLLRDKTVLVVDDDSRNVFGLCNILERHKMHVLIAEGGKRAIEMLRATPNVDVVLMDIMMAGMDGHQATRAIRSMERVHRIPVIALTALAMKGDRERSINAGASDYLTKPVDRDQLLAALRVCLSQVGAEAHG